MERSRIAEQVRQLDELYVAGRLDEGVFREVRTALVHRWQLARPADATTLGA